MVMLQAFPVNGFRLVEGQLPGLRGLAAFELGALLLNEGNSAPFYITCKV